MSSLTATQLRLGVGIERLGTGISFWSSYRSHVKARLCMQELSKTLNAGFSK